MNLAVGDTVQISGRNATVCYTTEYNNEKYICVAFDDGKVEYNIYKYIFENDKLLVSDVIPKEDMQQVLTIFLDEGIEEYGIPKELEPILNEVEKREEYLQNREEN